MGKYFTIRSQSFDDVAVLTEETKINPLKKRERPHTLPVGEALRVGRPKSIAEYYISNICAQGGSVIDDSEGGANGTTNFQTFLLVFKSFIGTGILVLPKAFVNGGILASSLFMLCVAALNTYVMIKLSHTKDACGETTIQAIGRRAAGWPMELWVSFSVVFIQISCGCMYLIFMGTTIKQVVETLSGCSAWALDAQPWVYFFSLVPIITPLVWIRDLKLLTIPAVAADVLIVGGLIYIFSYAVNEVADHGAKDYSLFNQKDFPIFLGTALFSFEGVCLVLPIKNAMKNPLDYPKVLGSVMVLLAIIYTSFSVINYLAFGKGMETAILLSLPSNSVPVLCVQIGYVIAIGLTFPLQFFPAVQVLENLIWRPSPTLPVSDYGSVAEQKAQYKRYYQENLFRFFLTILASGIATGGETNFDHFTALGGGLCSMPLLFVFPPLFHLLLVPNLSTWEKVIDVSIATLGLGLTIYTTTQTIIDWIEGHGDDADNPCVPI
eukprot:TRINITY_DN6855_c0_g1_i1.p1 TRINITY_DN6855_c0_g1~~TRINITY_DN6855_c0_g1_i1.p1  ORF type:complete len:494 (+),score=28.03 TRINITY_DN6855_c0_g1_i1:39-1520(+)